MPVALVNKPGKLTDDEMSVIREHPVIGARILEPITEYADLLPLVRYHHERIDGRGYPDGLRGDDIPILARILGVADTFDALTSDRPYRRGLALKTATQVVKNAAGTQLDEKVVDTFLGLVEDGVIKELRQQQKVRAPKPHRGRPGEGSGPVEERRRGRVFRNGEDRRSLRRLGAPSGLQQHLDRPARRAVGGSSQSIAVLGERIDVRDHPLHRRG